MTSALDCLFGDRRSDGMDECRLICGVIAEFVFLGFVAPLVVCGVAGGVDVSLVRSAVRGVLSVSLGSVMVRVTAGLDCL